MAIYGGAGIGAVIGWKFNHQAGMETVNGVITAFPVTSGVTLTDGIPSNEGANHEIVEDGDVPSDRTFRDAWTWA